MNSSDIDSALAVIRIPAWRLNTQEEATIQLQQYIIHMAEPQEGLLTALNERLSNLSQQPSSNSGAAETTPAFPTTVVVPVIPP